ncbi:hypothetical protein AYO20_10031 [Fonsecaea nubica]|uniref:Aspartate aminotransferase n=1 Tax=Fonsecaea nubica TaxID=856822 RepID=A0A178CAN5_9EURO|nr:hypothetical protein AYO20_10031 [Fonsecaea nubica]OAL26607.1 hypothetical protein AYO20_10031 [Fonsecaea nubica]
MATRSIGSLFSAVPLAPSDAAFALTTAYNADTSPNKVSLGSGVYRDDNGEPWVLPVVKKAKSRLDADPTVNHEYLPIVGHAEFITAAQSLVFGTDDENMCSRIASVQCISGTGANHLGARFFTDTTQPRQVWISDPTWDNHHLIWTLVNDKIQQRVYPYYDNTSRSLDFDGMVDVIQRKAMAGDVIILHACAHNPTGIDPSREQWKAIADLCETKKLLPFFDWFATGSLDEDAWPIRHFLSRETLEFGVAQSFAKNLGLYGERVGAFHLVTSTAADSVMNVRSQLARLSRGEISTPPVYGARIAATVLRDQTLFDEWKIDLETMSGRIRAMRSALYDALRALGTPGDWRHVVDQIGMFSYTGLTPAQVELLREDYSIYLLASGRISIAGCELSSILDLALVHALTET